MELLKFQLISYYSKSEIGNTSLPISDFVLFYLGPLNKGMALLVVQALQRRVRGLVLLKDLRLEGLDAVRALHLEGELPAARQLHEDLHTQFSSVVLRGGGRRTPLLNSLPWSR